MQETKLNSLMLPWPTDWRAVFGVARPLIVEIGFGDAEHLIALAQAHPDHNVIGFEISAQSMDKAERKIKQGRLANVRAIYSRGETALHHLFTPASVHQFHINYPDPWFKTRHAGRRLMQRDTLDALTNRLEIGGALYLATDILEYAKMSHVLLDKTPGLDNALATPWADHLPQRLITTKYEQKGLREGRPGNYFLYRRNAQPAPDVPVQEEKPVPHIVLSTPQTPQAIATNVSKTSFHHEGIHVALLDAYWNPRYNSVLFEVVIEEPTIEQHVALSLRRREDQAFTLRFASFGMPRPTDGLHYATAAIGYWLMQQDPDAAIITNSTRYTLQSM